MKKILVIGSGGREHALAWAAARSPEVAEVLVAPGNAGTAQEPKVRNVALDPMDFPGLIALAKDEGVALTIVGPAAPGCWRGGHFRGGRLALLWARAAAAQLEALRLLPRPSLPAMVFPQRTRFEPRSGGVRAYPGCSHRDQG